MLEQIVLFFESDTWLIMRWVMVISSLVMSLGTILINRKN